VRHHADNHYQMHAIIKPIKHLLNDISTIYVFLANSDANAAEMPAKVLLTIYRRALDEHSRLNRLAKDRDLIQVEL